MDTGQLSLQRMSSGLPRTPHQRRPPPPPERTPTPPIQAQTRQSPSPPDSHAPVVLGAPIEPYENDKYTHEWTGDSRSSHDHQYRDSQEWAGASPSEDTYSSQGGSSPAPPLASSIPNAIPETPTHSYGRKRQLVPATPEDELVTPHVLTPRPTRDTIHHIVDQYGDEDSAEEEEEEEGHPSRISIISASTVDSDVPQPKMVFDLTPGREPSPARYKHGQPLPLGEFTYCDMADRFSRRGRGG
jgi:hypothetical protein